jgi:uncharacterized SAM-binding protein YcdF (DUF218 family)
VAVLRVNVDEALLFSARTSIERAMKDDAANAIKRNARPKRRRWRIALAAGAVIIGLVPIRIATYDTTFPEAQTVDAAIVLGAAIYRDRPSPVFAARLDYARDLLRARRAQWVLVTGGFGEGEKHSEAEIGRSYLAAQGIDPNRILVETKSRTTFENVCNAAVIARHKGLRTFAIVSDPLHLRRAMQFAQDAGLHAVPAATPYTRYRSLETRLRFLLRESYFYARRVVMGGDKC